MALRIINKETTLNIKAKLDKLDELEPVSEGLMKAYWEKKQKNSYTILPMRESTIWRVQTLAKNQRLGKDDMILDIGCGDGEICAALRKSGLNAIGMDLSLNSVNPAGKYINGSAESIPLADESVKLILDSFTLYYTNMDCSLEEIKRVLVKGGRAMFMLHHIDKVEEATLELLQKDNVQNFELFLQKDEKAIVENYPVFRLITNVFESKEAILEFFQARGFQVLFLDEDKIEKFDNSIKGLDYCLVVQKP